MAFTSEIIPEAEQDRVALAMQRLGWTQVGSRWVVDRSQDVALLCSHYDGRGYDGPPGEFALLWKGEVIPFEVFTYGGPISEKYKDKPGHTAFHVLDDSIRLPAALISMRGQVIGYIKSALRVEGLRSPLWQEVDVEIVKLGGE